MEPDIFQAYPNNQLLRGLLLWAIGVFFFVIDHFDSQIENAQFLMEGSLLFGQVKKKGWGGDNENKPFRDQGWGGKDLGKG